MAISVRQNDSQSVRACPMRRGDSGSEATRSIGKASAATRRRIAGYGPQLDHFPQERQAGTAQGKGLVQFQIAAGGDLLGHRRQPRGA